MVEVNTRSAKTRAAGEDMKFPSGNTRYSMAMFAM